MAIGSSSREDVRAGAAQGPEEPLISNGSSLFEMRNRPRRDVPWLVTYLVILATALAGGVFSFVHRNTRYTELISDGIKNPSICPITATTHSARRLLQQGPDAPSPYNLDVVALDMAAWLGASLGGSILVGLLFVWLARVKPSVMVAAALILQVAVPAWLGFGALYLSLWVLGTFWLCLSALIALVLWRLRQQIELVTHLLGLSGQGLAANPGLVPTALGLQLGLAGLLEIPLLVAVNGAIQNGTLVYNTDRVDQGSAAMADQCVDSAGDHVDCCKWQVEGWVNGYLVIAMLAMTWSMFLVFQVKFFTVAGTIAQWYFQPTSATDEHGRRRSRTLTSLRFALGPSLGSLCAGSAVLTLVSMVRRMMQKLRRDGTTNLFAACLAACLSMLLALVEFVTQFATVRAAITGEAFFTAGRSVVALLKRNLMDTFGVWWLPPLILQSCSFLIAVAWGFLVHQVSYVTTWSHVAGLSPEAASNLTVITAVVAFLAAWAVLCFLASLLLNVIDALFVCFAMDRDLGQTSSPAVYDVMSKLPSVGAVVQQPDGGLAYGAPPEQQRALLPGSEARV
ncbi:hypothetical protein Vretimale_18798 [Volvox reticuliferus]|uniref:Choline transporter-like protein n=1 Tax=Volvox reticuliferus TaxID=1737510 RepID=A0A8J4GXV2_9CHLO|nr:hypothetical protein Vretifemale_18867 [Volvox reticuliferus]GIM16146.1 hypothetical protein Vretimale_18798 [Volvox reticuliferus]